ncbi:hypothetical protein HFP15_41585 [Amycolatopsis sp. K13G38]|uniref:Uncharacterized protein n=1 Tax=Amycolatopsis acididurans TaxID=2724524 RepID=A0ABX1JKK0_9PSEU|nr:hypothetical protein [Amycolatopsis acididurans]NKQ59349.1 hypothetical protein [Amycolatopsis acididurans]
MLTFRVWLIELPVAGLNWFVLAERVYRPRLGELRAHQIAMTTRIVYIFALAYVLLAFAGGFTPLDTLEAGAFWMLLWLAFEWGGSLLVRRPVSEIVRGWRVRRGYLWPYVLAAYLLAPLLVGLVVRPSAG